MSSGLEYKSEIDGLRALSVLAVVLFHAEIAIGGVTLLPGGFLGVDVFFVISGYLITRILLNELHIKGTINFARFYKRRARRLLPALLALMLVSIPFAWFRLLPEKLVEFAQSALAALTFVANFFFYTSTTAYGAADSELMPLLNTWSLSVEEQFYFVVPLALLALYKVGVRRLNLFFVSVALISFVLALYLTTENPSLNFYTSLTRAWEMMAGALLANRELSSKNRSRRFEYSGALVGIALIAISFCVFDKSVVGHPGPITFLPVLGSVLVLRGATGSGHLSKDIKTRGRESMSLAGRQSSTLLAKTLSCRPLAFTGLVSYSFYLWHFPLFAFARNGNPNPTLAERLIWIVLSFVISVFSWRFIETPFRKSKRKSDLALALIAIGLIVAFCLGAITSKGFDFRVPKFLRGESNHTEILMFNNERCEGNDALQCVFSVDKKQKQRVILVGDSHADSLAGDLLQKVKSEAVNAFVYMARNNCPLMLGFTYPSMGCTQEVQQKRVELIESSAGDVVVYVGLMGWMQKRYRNDAEKLRATLRRIAKDRKLVLVYPIPSVGVHVPQYFNERARGFSANEAHKVLSGYPLTTSLAEHLKTHRELFKIYDSIEGDNVYRVYAHKAFCDTALKGRCIVNDAENVYYRDINHPSPAGSHLINEKIMTAIRQAIEH